MKTRVYHTEIKAYAAFNDRGQLLYGTIKPTKDEATEYLNRFNPPVDGFHYPYKVLPVFIGTEAGFQHEFSI